MAQIQETHSFGDCILFFQAKFMNSDRQIDRQIDKQKDGQTVKKTDQHSQADNNKLRLSLKLTDKSKSHERKIYEFRQMDR